MDHSIHPELPYCETHANRLCRIRKRLDPNTDRNPAGIANIPDPIPLLHNRAPRGLPEHRGRYDGDRLR
jgi:hypothetical protein